MSTIASQPEAQQSHWRHDVAHAATDITFLSWITSRSPLWWTNAFLIVGVITRLIRFLLRFPIWGDEAMLMLNLIDRSWDQLLDPLKYGQVAPPLFVASEWAMLHGIGPSEYSLRLLPLLASLGSLVLFRNLAMLWLPPFAAALAMGFLALGNWPIGMGSLIKPYAWDLFGSLLLLLPALQYLRHPDRTGSLWVLACLPPLVLLGSFPSVFIASTVSLALLSAVWREHRLSAWLGYGAFCFSWLGAFAICYFVSIARTTPETRDGMLLYWRAAFPPSEPLRLLWWLFQAHTGQMLAYPVGSANGGSILTAILVVTGLSLWVRERSASLLILFVTPLALGILGSMAGRYPYAAAGRLTQHVAPLICLAAGAGLASFLQNPTWQRGQSPSRLLAWVGAVLLVVAVGGTAMAFVKPYRQIDDLWLRSFSEKVLPTMGPNDRILSSADPADETLHTSLRWHLIQNRHRILAGQKLTEADLSQITGDVWLLHYDLRQKPHFVSSANAPAMDALRWRVQEQVPNRVLVEQVPFMVPQVRETYQQVIYLERWSLPGREAKRVNLTVWP